MRVLPVVILKIENWQPVSGRVYVDGQSVGTFFPSQRAEAVRFAAELAQEPLLALALKNRAREHRRRP